MPTCLAALAGSTFLAVGTAPRCCAAAEGSYDAYVAIFCSAQLRRRGAPSASARSGRALVAAGWVTCWRPWFFGCLLCKSVLL